MTIYSHLSYLEKQRFLPRQIESSPPKDLRRVIVIPAYDEPQLLRTLASLEECQAAAGATEVIVALNSGASRDEAAIAHMTAAKLAWENWVSATPKQLYHHLLIIPQLPKKQAGVGLVRKIGMDEAVDRLLQADYPEGLIICLDADCTVAPTYLKALQNADRQYPRTEAFSLNFAHPLMGSDYEASVYEAITAYELYLRYYVEALRWAGHPHAYHCIGSSMAVRANGYQLRGGMNRRKAGEDFYFLQKFIQENTLRELGGTTVFPSPRPSHRVPFGTGRAVQGLLDQSLGKPGFAWESFEWLRQFILQIPSWYQQDPTLKDDALTAYLMSQGWLERLEEIRNQVRSEAAFVKRFFKWFTGLKVLQYLHYARDQQYSDRPIVEACEALYRAQNWALPNLTAYDLLIDLRLRQE